MHKNDKQKWEKGGLRIKTGAFSPVNIRRDDITHTKRTEHWEITLHSAASFEPQLQCHAIGVLLGILQTLFWI